MLLDDGRLRLNVTSKSNAEVETQVLVGGRLSDRKGINLPGVMLPISPLTEKDLVDLRFALELGCEWIALSFVQRPEDVVEARRLIGNRAHVLVKVEKPSRARPYRRDCRRRRCRDGGSWRSRRGNASGGSADRAEDHHPHLPRRCLGAQLR